MKTTFILAFILLLLSFHSNAQQTIDKLNVNQLKLPKESANKALILDGAGQVKSSSTITDTELGYLEGLSDTLVNLLSGKANDSDVVKLSGNQSVDGVKTFTGKLVASSTVNGSIPCPVMTEAERDLFTPVEGDCVYNSDTLKLNVYDGSVWKDVGGAGGISLWLTANPYNVNDIVIESDKIYRCLIAHTSGTFATDLGAGNWGEVSQGLTSPVALADGGTGLSITPVAGSIVYVDADSFEILTAGVLGQVLQSNGAGAPSWVNKSISAKSENGSSVTAEELQVSNNQLTQVDTNKHLIESGNNNLLINPSFEHSTFSTGWTNSVGTFTEESVLKIHGKKAAKLVLSSETMSLTQSSTLYQAQFADGVQGLASVRVKSDVALKVCSIQAATVSTTNCVDVQSNNKWGLYKVPFILGATSNGISIASTGAVSGTVYIDDAFLGAVDLKVDIPTANFQSSYISQAASFGISTITGALTESKGSGNYSYNPVTGIYTVLKRSQFTVSASFRGSASVAVQPIISGSSYVDASVEQSVSTANAWTSTSFSFIGEIGATIFIRNGANTTDIQRISITSEEIGSSSVYSSTNADTDWASCGHTTSSFTGFGTVTAIETQCKRQGGDLLMRGKFTSGSTTAVEARMALPVWNGTQLVSSGVSLLPSIQKAGSGARSNVNGFSLGILIEPNVSYSVFSIESSSASGLLKANGNALVSPGELITFFSRIPIEGWQQSNIIIGQFNGLESCLTTLDCTDTFSAKVSAAGVVSAENVDWIDGSCTFASGLATCNIKTGIFSVTPNCTASMFTSTTSNNIRVDSASATQFQVYTQIIPSTGNNTAFNIICQKQGVDYIGKTAKAVASDQNVRSIGSVGVDIQSVFFGGGASCVSACTISPCTICSQTGSKITSITRNSTGNYNLNGIDGTKYQCTGGSDAATGYGSFVYKKDQSNSSFARVALAVGGILSDSIGGSIICIGVP